MKYSFAILSTAFLVIIFGSSIAQSPTAPALGFNVFLQNDAILSTNETEGPVALGGNLKIAGNYQVSTNQTGSFMVGGITTTLVVGKKVIFHSGNALQVNQNGYVKIGDCKHPMRVWYTDMNNANSPLRITKNNNYNASPFLFLQANAQQLGVSATNNPVCQSNVIDFGNAFQQLKSNSIDLSLCTANAQLTNPNGQPIQHTNLPNQVKIELQSGKNVLNITGADLNRVNVFTYNQKPNANRYLIINVDAPNTFKWKVWNQAGVGQQDCPYILYNFYNTTELRIEGNSTVEGTILAPLANIIKTVNQSNIEGQVIGQSFHHSGGEVHYANFTPNEPGCAAAIPTVTSAFSVDTNAHCLDGNSFQFSNSSYGHPNLTYFWDFGDGNNSTFTAPSHSYSQAGTYQVKLIATAPFGSDSSFFNVIVHPHPQANFSVNDTIQALSNNAFAFSVLNTSNIQSYNWNFDDGNSSTSASPSHSFAAVGAYDVALTTTSAFECAANFNLLVSVQSDSSSSGNDGGIESESLEGQLSQLNYQKLMQRMPSYVAADASRFSKNQSVYTQRNSAERSARVEQFIPLTNTLAGDGFISTPHQLIAITNAEEMVTVDYKLNAINQAAILGSISHGKPYNHTKYTCDRFLKGEIMHVQAVEVNQMDFVLFAIKKFDGLVEYGIEFSVGYNQQQSDFDLQSGWLIDEYEERDTMYNYQIWGRNPQIVTSLLEDVLNAIQAEKQLVQLPNFEYPKVYVTKGKRIGSNLFLTLKNNTKDPFLTMKWCEKRNENVGFDTLSKSVISLEDSIIELSFIVNDDYEFDIYFYLNDTLMDKVYMADANWGLDFDLTYTLITGMPIQNRPDRTYKDEYPLYRDVRIIANTADYVTIFKDLTAGGLPTDLSEYIGLQFFAKGTGPILLRMFVDGVNNWRSQFTTRIDLTDEGDWHKIPFTTFASDTFPGTMPLHNLKTISFVYESISFDYEDVDFSIEEAGFVKQFTNVAVAEPPLNEEALLVFPNPNNGNFSLKFSAENSEQVLLNCMDITGRILWSSSVFVQNGMNELPMDLGATKLSKGNYILQLVSPASGQKITKFTVN